MKTMRTMAALVTALVFVVSPGWAQTSDDKAKEHAELAKALKDAKIPLQQGLTASTKEGKPISAKYEVEDGKLQLSVYTMKGDNFSEVIVDHKTGKIAKAEPITKSDDLTHAKEQSEAMAKAKRSLSAAASEAVKENKGYRVVSVMPTVKDGHPVADVMLVKGTEWKTVTEKLD
jgi:outer membrane lipoprotein-sorting protein